MTLEKARQLVGGYTHGYTEAQKDTLAHIMVENDCCVFHACYLHAQSMGKSWKCYCADCCLRNCDG